MPRSPPPLSERKPGGKIHILLSSGVFWENFENGVVGDSRKRDFIELIRF
jgi:hypothetical protein